MTKTATKYRNNGRTLLAANISAGDTTIQVSDISKLFTSLAAGEFFYVTLQDSTHTEIVKVTGVSGSVLTGCSRGQGGTSAYAFSASTTRVENRLVAADLGGFARLVDRMDEISGVDHLLKPSLMNSNSYLCGLTGADYSNPVVVKLTDDLWSMVNYPTRVYTGTVGSGATTLKINVAGAPALFPVNTDPWEYAIQFLTGAYQGQIRILDSVNSGDIRWTSPFPTAPASTDTFEIRRYVGSNVYTKQETYSKAEVDSLVQWIVPVGSIIYRANSNTGGGRWLIANGAAVSRTTYALLFSTIGVMYGAGDGSSTFNLPDLRGEFIRGGDLGRGIDVGRGIGTWQADALKAHTHAIWRGQATTNTTTGSTGGDNPSFDGVSGSTGDVETRPRNIAMLPMIKYD